MKHGCGIDANESYSNLTGYERDELIGHTSSELNIIGEDERKQYINQSKESGLIRMLILK